MPSISDPNTVKALAREYIASGKVKEKGLRGAGYSKSYARTSKGMKLYARPDVIAAIAEIEAEVSEESNVKVKTRIERQGFWSAMMDDTAANRADKLRASELLGRSEADFTDNVNTRDMQQPEDLTEQERKTLKDIAETMTKPRLSKETG